MGVIVPRAPWLKFLEIATEYACIRTKLKTVWSSMNGHVVNVKNKTKIEVHINKPTRGSHRTSERIGKPSFLWTAAMSAKSTWNAYTVLRSFYPRPVSEALTRM